ncbi:2-C-methyl-D-erythritol 4-phosphate cytidylyltransferase [Cricetibacter osteomyelitidis]|uniref:2-C-methyl-D-erythritol 4-phosphate cytidylyltransferase n=1 Tax=Cricetibacter osteomyelitidis TaxID=1521931 RepID=A0A4R2SZB9_9PAST|nr:2-C-methyl-D-erythritol 4-phosphate cytidylyltransferase [Cricetibacter osteomyelitidis]TCP94875.1 2-C-methyl-D-erythritol 4-phosphate cytidylyltransferase [Cricetibacter osteomyelitidis]
MTALSRQIIAIVPAAGIGTRMLVDKPKQYLQLQGKTILEHTLQVLLDYSPIRKIVMAIAENDPFISQLALIHNPKIQLVQGGATRADSVLAGLNTITDHRAWALVHDAARPCLTHSDLDKLVQIHDEQGAILATPVIDTIKRATAHNQIQRTEDRSRLWHALTPQFFHAHTLRNALVKGLNQGLTITDEASAMELAGFQPHLIAGRADNIKITRPEDLTLAEFYLSKRT